MLQIFLNCLKQAASGFSKSGQQLASGMALVEAGLGSPLVLAWAPPS